MIAAAAGYVRASGDLRPRVLEAARAHRRERRGRRRVWQLAAAFLLVCSLAGAMGRRFQAPDKAPLGAWGAVGQGAIYERAEARAIQCGGLSWGIVEAFLDLRRAQSEKIDANL